MVKKNSQGRLACKQPNVKKKHYFFQFEGTPNDIPIDVKEVGFMVPTQGGPWRIGKPSNLENWKTSIAIFMRLPRKNEGSFVSSKELSAKHIKLSKYFHDFKRKVKPHCLKPHYAGIYILYDVSIFPNLDGQTTMYALFVLILK